MASSPDPANGARRLGVALGGSYGKLWSATALSTVGDGIYFTALALLAAHLTRDPLSVAFVEIGTQLPWLLFALPAGALVDRWNRRRVMWMVDAYRCVVVGVLTLLVLTGTLSIVLLAAIGFLLTSGETLFDPASRSMLPAIVSRDTGRLELANGRLVAVQTAGGQFFGPPLGGLLFSLTRWVPFLADGVSFAMSSALIVAIRGEFDPPRAPDRPRAALREEVVEGIRWLIGHRLLRTLAVMVGVTNLVFAMWTAILVLFAQEKLRVGSFGYGLLWTGLAAGSLLGSLLASRFNRVVGTGWLLTFSAVIFGATTVGLGLTSTPVVAGVLLGVLGVAVTVWNVVTVSLRQALVPDGLSGRVNSVYQLASMGMLPVGAGLGGLIGRTLGLRAPFLIAGAVLLAVTAVTLPSIVRQTTQASAPD